MIDLPNPIYNGYCTLLQSRASKTSIRFSELIAKKDSKYLAFYLLDKKKNYTIIFLFH